ncbi:MAG: hypothetical protein ACRD0U_09785 [Acidimicrobiales bacterium]
MRHPAALPVGGARLTRLDRLVDDALELLSLPPTRETVAGGFRLLSRVEASLEMLAQDDTFASGMTSRLSWLRDELAAHLLAADDLVEVGVPIGSVARVLQRAADLTGRGLRTAALTAQTLASGGG